MQTSYLKSQSLFFMIIITGICLFSACSENKAATVQKDADYELGLKYYYGDGVLIDRAKSKKLFRKAADRDHVLAKTFVGLQYALNQGDKKDLEEATRWYKSAMPELRELAENSLAIAQYRYGWMYDLGLGVEEDDTEAVKWYRKAAEQKYAPAQSKLGWMYKSGRGVEQDDNEAVKWYRQAAAQKLASAQYRLGRMYEAGCGVEKSNLKAFELYGKAVDQNYAGAQVQLGHHLGRAGMDKGAAMLFHKAAEQGHRIAQCNLGLYYQHGWGVEKNIPEATKWYLKAAKQDYPRAQYNVGRCYFTGAGFTKKDYEEGMKWYRKAAAQGFSDAIILVEGWNSKFKQFPTDVLLNLEPELLTVDQQADLLQALMLSKRKNRASLSKLELQYENFLLNAASPVEFEQIGIPRNIQDTSDTMFNGIQSMKSTAVLVDRKISQLRKLTESRNTAN